MIKIQFVKFLRKTRLMSLANNALNLKNSFLKKIAKRKGKSDIDVIYDDKFFVTSL